MTKRNHAMNEDILFDGKRSLEGKAYWRGSYRATAYRIKNALRRYAV